MILHNKLQLHLIKKLLSKEGEEGFSLLELVVIIAVLALLAAIGLPQLKDVLNGARLSAAKMSLSECRKQCELNPDEPLALTPINGVVYESTRDCNSEVRAVIDGQTEEFPCLISMDMDTGITSSNMFESGWPTSYKTCLERAIWNGRNPPEARCLAIGPGICGHPPCGSPVWHCTGECPANDPPWCDRRRLPTPDPIPDPIPEGTQIRWRNIYGGSGTPDDDWLGGYDGLPSGCRMLKPGETVWEKCPSGCVRTPGGNGEGTCP